MAKMFRVYSIIERKGQDDYWLNIGVAFPHEDGKGFNVMLQALPIHGNGKIVLREHDQKDQAEDDAGRDNGRRPAGSGNSRGRDRNDNADRRTDRR
ncbi:MAG: hypothetical protein K8F62_17545 [Pseudorhodoplanes sp.]|nr:hypothetical protein [Pseudorhodoplanes sp.]